MSPELWLWKHTQHRTKAKFSNVSHNLCYSPGGGLAGTAWTGRHRSCREEFRAMTVILTVTQQTLAQMKGKERQAFYKVESKAGGRWGPGVSQMYEGLYAMDALLFCPCSLLWEVHGLRNLCWFRQHLENKPSLWDSWHCTVLISWFICWGLPVCSHFPLWMILVFHLYPQACLYFFSPFPSIQLGS